MTAAPQTHRLEVLHVPDCASLKPLLERLARVSDLPVITHEVSTDTEALARGMAGSPTLLIDGIDPFASSDDCACGLSCRLYRDPDGRIVSAPSIDQLRDAIATAAAADHPSRSTDPTPGEVLSAWRTRAVPLDPAEKAVQQAILRAFAATGQPPAAGDLEPVAGRFGQSAAQTLTALHDLDAIRLTPSGRIRAAYPFSAAPTRHRVHLGNGASVYAMCAIDALGMSAMLGTDTRIESVDVTTGQPITVSMTADGTSRWEPAGAVVFVGATAGGGPSADCCCDYLNFFSDSASATAWTDAHPTVPGQILDRAAAEALGIRLFGSLLTA